jgi:hypothetical protein
METSIREAKIELINIAIKMSLPTEAQWSVLRQTHWLRYCGGETIAVMKEV